MPLAEHRLLVPRANVAEVTGLREISAVPDVAPRTRVLLLRTLTDAPGCPYYGLLTQGFPQLVRVNAMVLAADDSASWPEDGPVLCQLKMVNQRPLVPDLEHIEAMIAQAVATPGRG